MEANNVTTGVLHLPRYCRRHLLGGSFWASTVLASIVLAGCQGEQSPPASPPPLIAGTRAPLDADALLKHKMECRVVGVQAEKDKQNTVDSANQGLIYFESVYAYSENLNTCVMLSGIELTNLKTRKVTTFQATLTDLLSNNMLGTYLVLGGGLAPVSTTKVAFMSQARKLVGEPLPRWLELAPEP